MEEIRAGELVLKLASTEKEYQQLWRLRYNELLKDYNKDLESEVEDDYDEVCDHLIIVDTTIDEVVGTYRLIKKSQLHNLGKFLTENEYDLTLLKKYEVLEVGRAVVKEEYRNGAAISILWKGLIKYAVESGADFMVGTASFHGIDPTLYQDCFAYLYDKHLAKPEFRCEVNKNSFYQMDTIKEYDEKKAFETMPPLVKGYLRLGAWIGDGVYIDYSFNSLDVLIILKIDEINQRYLSRFTR